MTLLGYILVGAGCIAGLVGDVRFLVVAHRQGLFWFFGCLFVPFAGVAFFLLNLRETWKPVLAFIAGLLLIGIGCSLACIELVR